MKPESSPKKHALTPSSVSLVPPEFVLRGGTSLVSSYSSFFSQTLNNNTNQAYANGVKLFWPSDNNRVKLRHFLEQTLNKNSLGIVN